MSLVQSSAIKRPGDDRECEARLVALALVEVYARRSFQLRAAAA
jgi:hypothetical protein